MDQSKGVGRVAIMAAMPEELSALLAAMPDARAVMRAGRAFWLAQWCGHEVVAVLSRIGKVAAATTTTLLLSEFGVSRVLFTGVAGGLAPGVRVGDVVVADALLQHDMDASPLFPRYELPGLGLARLRADESLRVLVAQAAAEALQAEAYGEARPMVHQGLVISGDIFVDTSAESQALRTALPDALAVEMEGAAVAQVCHDFGVPCAVIRTISDRADDAAHVDFQQFVAEVASHYSLVVVEAVLKRLPVDSVDLV